MFNHFAFFILFLLTPLLVTAVTTKPTMMDTSLRSLAEFVSYISKGPCSSAAADNIAALKKVAGSQSCPSVSSLNETAKDAKEMYGQVFFELGQ